VPGSVTVPSTLKGHAADIWRAAFLASCEGTCKGREDKDSCAASIAWTAVKENYKKGDSGEWVAKGGPMTEQTKLIERKEFSAGQRGKLAEENKAMPGGGYPIESEQDLRNAIHAIGRAKNRAMTIRHIMRRAKALGLMKLIPAGWVSEVKSLAQIIRAVPGDILVRRIAREHEATYDVELTQRGLANTEAVRPACFESEVWRGLPASERTYGALLRRRFISRQYHEAVDQMLENGWEARKNPNRPEEFIFRGYVNTPDGAVFVRDILVRRRGTGTWYPREVSRGAAASTSIMLDPQEIRYRGPEIEIPVH